MQANANAICPLLWAAVAQGLPLEMTARNALGRTCSADAFWRLIQLAVWNDRGQTVASMCVRYSLPLNASMLLTCAARFGSMHAASALLHAKASVNGLSYRASLQIEGLPWFHANRTPLLQAAHLGHIDMLGLLVSAKANVEMPNGRRGTPLLVAAARGHAECVALLLNVKAIADARYLDGDTALHAVSSVAVAQLLLDAKAQAHARNSARETAIWCTTRRGGDDAALTQCLLDAHASVHESDRDDYTLLHLASSQGNRAVASVLVKAKADVNASDDDGVTPLACAAGWPATVAFLLKKRADVHAIDGYYVAETPLFKAATIGCEVSASLLLRAKAVVDARNYHGVTPLYVAATNGWESVVSVLLAAKAEVDYADAEYRTPLFSAVRCHCTAVVRVLLEAKADATKTDIDSKTPLWYAQKNKHARIVALLVAATR